MEQEDENVLLVLNKCEIMTLLSFWEDLLWRREMTQNSRLKAQSKWEFKVSWALRGLAQSVSADHKFRH